MVKKKYDSMSVTVMLSINGRPPITINVIVLFLLEKGFYKATIKLALNNCKCWSSETRIQTYIIKKVKM